MITILGASLAGLRTAVALREAGYQGQIRTIDADPHPPYDRPPLSKDLLGTFVRPLSAEGLGHLSEVVDEIVTAQVTRYGPGFVDTDQGSFETDYTVVALGASPHPIPGTLPLRTRSDAEAIRSAWPAPTAILGGGWIGCELAATLALSKEAPVTLVEARDHLLIPEISNWISTYLQSLGVTIVTGSTLADAPLIINATGVTPPSIDTDAWGRTSDPTMFALGDCATWNDAGLAGHWNAVLAQAPIVAQALMADINGTELGEPPSIIPDVFSTIGSVDLAMIGYRKGTPITLANETFRCVWVENGTLAGGLIANRPADIAALRKNIGKPIDPALCGDDQLLKKILRASQA